MGGRRVEGGAERRQEAVEAYRAALSVFRLAIGDEQTNVREWRTRVAQNEEVIRTSSLSVDAATCVCTSPSSSSARTR